MGSSFYPKPEQVTEGAYDATTALHETGRICSTLSQTLATQEAALAAQQPSAWDIVKSAAQVLIPGYTPSSSSPKLDEHEVAKITKHIERVKHHYDAVCNGGKGASAEGDEFLFPVDALLALLPRINPDGSFVEPSLDRIYSTPHHDLAPKPAVNEPPTEMISGPGLADAGVLGDVKARLMYTQTSSEPRLVWKLEVEMQHNWYEAYVDARSGETLRIVDWAQDYSWTNDAESVETFGKGGKQKPLPSPKHPKHPKATYSVFPWGEYIQYDDRSWTDLRCQRSLRR